MWCGRSDAENFDVRRKDDPAALVTNVVPLGRATPQSSGTRRHDVCFVAGEFSDEPPDRPPDNRPNNRPDN